MATTADGARAARDMIWHAGDGPHVASRYASGSRFLQGRCGVVAVTAVRYASGHTSGSRFLQGLKEADSAGTVMWSWTPATGRLAGSAAPGRPDPVCCSRASGCTWSGTKGAATLG